MLFLKKQTLQSWSLVSITYWGRSSCSNSGWLLCSDTFKIDNTTFYIFSRQPPTILGHYSCQKPSIMTADPRCIVGSMVEAKACHATNLAECSRHYGSNSKVKRVQGIMTHVEVIKNSTTNMMTTFMMAAYNLGGTTIHPWRLEHSISQGGANSHSGNCHYSWWRIAWVNRQRFDDDKSYDTSSSHRTYVGGPDKRRHIVGRTCGGSVKGTTLNYQKQQQYHRNNDTPLPQHTEAAATVHDQEWFVDDPAMKLPVNGNYHFCNWAINTRMGYMIGQGGDHQNSYSRLEYFLMLFPPEQLQLILQLTNNELAMARKNYTMAGEIVKFFGVMLLVTRFEFGSQASLWSNTSTNKYIPAPSFGLTGMPRKWFDDLWMCIRFSDEPHNRPSEMTSEQYRWKLVDDFIKNFNEHRAQNFSIG